MKEINWMQLIGSSKIGKNELIFCPNNTIINGEISKNISIIGSNFEFETGEISFDLKIDEYKKQELIKEIENETGKKKDFGCQIILNSNTNIPEVRIGVMSGRLYSIQRFVNNQTTQIETLSISGGSSEVFEFNKKYNVRIKVEGTSIMFYINGVVVGKAQTQIERSQIRLLCSGDCDITINNFKVKSEKPKVFVIMQYSVDYDNLYNQVIKPICVKFGFECIRADEVNGTGLILEDITKSIRTASIVIADITPNNPNVFYEVGYSHAINKSTILLSDKKREEKLPFDISGFRTIFYDNTINGKGNVERDLIKIMESLTSKNYEEK